MLYRNAAAPWLYAAGSVVLGFVGFRAVSALKRGGRVRDAAVPLEQQSQRAALQNRGENVEPKARRAVVAELLDEELEALLDGDNPVPGDAYDAVALDDLATEWLSRATEARGIASADEPLDTETAELLRDAGMSVVSEATLNSASPEQFDEADVERDATDPRFELESDDQRSKIRQ